MNHPQMAQQFRLMNDCNLPRFLLVESIHVPFCLLMTSKPAAEHLSQSFPVPNSRVLLVKRTINIHKSHIICIYIYRWFSRFLSWITLKMWLQSSYFSWPMLVGWFFPDLPSLADRASGQEKPVSTMLYFGSAGPRVMTQSLRRCVVVWWAPVLEWVIPIGDSIYYHTLSYTIILGRLGIYWDFSIIHEEFKHHLGISSMKGGWLMLDWWLNGSPRNRKWGLEPESGTTGK